MGPDNLHEQIAATVKKYEQDLATLCKKIHDNPELRYEEHQAHDNICDFLDDLGYNTSRHTYGLDTSFEAEYGSGGRVVVFNAEYDALPGLGHACGHNLIATASVAAFIATAKAMELNHIPGRVRILGTPAEESGGGKIALLEKGAYDNVDACLMGHPLARIDNGDQEVHGTAIMKTLARKHVRVTYKGKSAHAGLCPWEGHNALDAVVSSYVNISMLRQQLPTTARVQGVIRNGGAEPNIIPDQAVLEYYCRDTNAPAVEDMSEKVAACFEGGATATGCSVDIEWDKKNAYKELRPNRVIAHSFTQHMSKFEKPFLEESTAAGGASTDMGNVCDKVPGFHCGFSIDTGDPRIGPHSPGFAAAAGTKSALRDALDCGMGMAATAYDILSNDKLAQSVRADFEKQISEVRT
ncbi:hypothetical protein AAFC00_000692 [Neodothiora populina]